MAELIKNSFWGSGGVIFILTALINRSFEERDSWYHLFQDRTKPKISLLYLHVRTEFIEVSVSVFFHFLWSING